MAIEDIFARVRERKGLVQDVSGLQQFLLQQQQSQGAAQQLAAALSVPSDQRQGLPGINFPTAPQLPQAQSTQGAQLFGNTLLQQQQQQGALGLQAARPRTPESESQFTAFLGRKIAAGKATKEEETLFEQLTKVPEGTQIFTGAFTQLQKPLVTKIQGEIKDAKIDIANLENIESSFRDEFAQIPFKIGQKITKVQELFGIPITQKQRKNLAEFSAWRRGAQREFVVFKKWATGVAAGQREMSEQIETAFPSGLKDSATEFRSKIRDAIKVRKRTQQILTDILNTGTVLNPQQNKDAKQQALSQALSEHLEHLGGGGGQRVQPGTQTPPAPDASLAPPDEFKADFSAWRRVTKPSVWQGLPQGMRNRIRQALIMQIRWTDIVNADDIKAALEKAQ